MLYRSPWLLATFPISTPFGPFVSDTTPYSAYPEQGITEDDKGELPSCLLTVCPSNDLPLDIALPFMHVPTMPPTRVPSVWSSYPLTTCAD